MSNPPIYVTGNTPVISVNVGDYDNFPIIVYLTSLNLSQRGFNVTVRNNDGVGPGARRIYISTFQPDPDQASLKFSDGTDTYLLGYNAGASFTTTFKDNTKWMKEITVIQGNTLLNREDIIGYGANVSSMVVSSFSTNADLYVQGESRFIGPLIGLMTPTFVTAVSTLLFSTGILYTSTLQILEGIQTSFLTTSNITAFSTNNASRLSSLFFQSVSTFTSSFTLLNNTLTSEGRFIASNGALTASFPVGTYTYATLEQSGYSNISTQIAPTISANTVGGPVSSLSTIVENSLISARYDTGLSSFSTSIRAILDTLTVNYGLTNMSNAFDSAMSSINASIGISSIYQTTQLGLSTVAEVPGGVLLSTNISQSLSSLAVQPGLSSISSLIGPGLSSITAFVPISTLSTSISLSASTVDATYGIQNLSTVVSYALSSVAANTGMERISSIFAYGISSMAAAPGLSSLSTTIFSTASTFKSALIVSSMSSLISYGLSSLVANTAFSSIQSTLIIGLSSILDYGYLPYSNARGLVTSTNITSPGLSSLLGTLSTGFSTISDGPGISSISSFFPISLSTIAIGPGLSSLSTVISRSLSSIFVPMPFPPTYSTQSTIISSLYLRDFSSGQYALFQLSGENILLSSIHYPERLSYLNSSTISTLVYEAKGSTVMSSIVVSSMNLTSSFVVQGIITTSLITQSTLVSSLTMTDTVTGLPRELVFINSVPYFTTVNGLQEFINTASTTASTISTAYGYGILDLTENVNYLAVSTITPFALSSISLELGLRTIEALADSNLLPNKSTLSTLNLFASTVTVRNLTTVSFSTALISTLFVSAQTLYTSSLRTFNAQISSINPALLTVNQVLGNNITASSISTGSLSITSSLVTSSFNIHHSLAVVSTASTARLNISTLNFNPINTSTIFAASGLLNIGWGGTYTLNSLQSRAIAGSQQANFFGFPRGLSVPNVYVSTIYTSSFIVSSAISSYSVDVQGIVSSGNSFYGGFDNQTTLDQFIERDRESSIRGYGLNPLKTGHKSWGVLSMYSEFVATPAITGGTNEPTTNINPSVLGFRNLPGIINANNIYESNANLVPGIPQFGWSTLSMLYDGKKILLCGIDSNATNSNCIANYIIPASYSNYVGTTPATGRLTIGGPYWQSTTATIFPTSKFTSCRNIAWNGSIYVATGNAASGDTAGTIKYSFDGFTWSNCMSGGWATADNSRTTNSGGWASAWNGYMWVCVGSNSSGQQAAQYSYDGINWTNVTSGTSGGFLRKIVYRNNVWTAAGQGYTDCNLKYSFDGLNWLNCRWSGATINNTNNGEVTALFVGPRYVMASFSLGASISAITYLSFDGINFNLQVIPDPRDVAITEPNVPAIQPVYDGINTKICYFVRNLSPGNGGFDGFSGFGRNISLNQGGYFLIRGYAISGTNGNYRASITTPSVANSNVIPSLKMSNLEIYGSNFQPLLKSTNTIVGHANNTAMTSNGDNAYSERQNILMINDTLEIVAHLSTQIKINTPGNPNTTSTNFMNFPRETLDVLCTMNVSQAGLTRGFYQIGSGLRTSTLGQNDRQFDVHFGRSTFVNSIAIGRGVTSNDYFSSPVSRFETYCAPGTYVTFRETTCNDTIVKNLLDATGLTTGVTCYPMVTGTNGNLIYYFKNQAATFKFIDTTGTGFFTGQHPTNCIDISISSVNDYVGKLVTVADQGYTIYTPTGQKVTGKDAILITSATPVTKLATTDKDPNVFGVVTNAFNNAINSDGTVNSYLDSQFNEDLFDRIMVNSIGEGAIWVSNYSGNVSNGDYLCSCPIPGLARKQDDGRLWNYTVAKATMSCDFNPPFVSSISTFIWEESTMSTVVSCLAYKCEPVEYNGSSFLQAFIGCTYHCG